MKPNENRPDQPLAIIGMNCRFPGNANNHRQLWENMLNQIDGVTEVPKDRWDANSFYHENPDSVRIGTSKWGGFIQNVDQFDPEAFGISPREAHQMDPQQRVSLEVAKNVFLDAGYDPAIFSNKSVGVFMGVSTFDYIFKGIGQFSLDDLDTYCATGTSLSIIANRISYIFNLWGPSFIVDTACSSSLMAIHLASQSIWRGDAEVALAGGVNLILEPTNIIAFSKMGLLSPHGRCKAFSEEALGFVRGEGAGMILLKPLDKAISDGDRIYACIRATGTNQDGKTNGIAVPNQKSQEALFRKVYARAGIAPEEVGYVEAHGTGTTVGDFIEANSIGNVIGKAGNRSKPLYIGSIKTHLGHLEAASGIAGLIKASLVLHHEKIPPNLHFEKPNKNIPFKNLGLKVVDRLTPLKKSRFAAVNSFGFGGANVHIILEKPPLKSKQRISSLPVKVLHLTASSEARLKELAKLYKDHLSWPEVSLTEAILSTLSTRKTDKFKLDISVDNKEECIRCLEQFINDEDNAKNIVLSDEENTPKEIHIGFVFSGQGPQWFAMGKQLLEQHPVFRKMMQKCDVFVKKYGGWSVLEELHKPEDQSRIYDTAFAQPAITCFQISLAEVFKKYGVKPEAVVGHSIGEIAAGFASGAYDLETAMRIIVERGATMGKYSRGGRMVAVDLPQSYLYKLAYGHDPEQISIAAINSPTGFTFAGEESIVDDIVKKCEELKYFGKKLRVEHAFHSAFMNPIEKPLKKALDGIKVGNTKIPMASTVTGDWVKNDEPLDEHYWWENVRNQVRFYPAVSKLIEKGINVFIEIAPHPVLTPSLHTIIKTFSKDAIHIVPTIYRKENEIRALGLSIGKLQCLDYPVKWTNWKTNQRLISSIPGFPYDRKTYWQEGYENKIFRLEPILHPLLGKRIAHQRSTFVNFIQAAKFPYLDDHRFRGNMLFPGTGYLETFLAFAQHQYPDRWPVRLQNIRFEKGLIIPEEVGYVQTMVDYDVKRKEISIHSRTPYNYESWMTNCRAELVEQSMETFPEIQLNPAEIKEKFDQVLPGELFYYHIQLSQLQFGERFRGIQRFWRSDTEILAEIEIPSGVDLKLGLYHFHPVLLDMTLQASTINRPPIMDTENARYTMVPVRIDRITFLHPLKSGKLSVYVKKLRDTPRNSLFNSFIFNEQGICIATLENVELYGVEMISNEDGTMFDDWVHYLHWEVLEKSAKTTHSKTEPVDFTQIKNLTEQLNRIAAEEATVALIEMGLKDLNGKNLSVLEIIDKLNIHEKYIPFIKKSLEEIHHRKLGIIKSHNKWKIDLNGIKQNNSKTTFLREYPESSSFVLPIIRTGSKLPKYLTGLEETDISSDTLSWSPNLQIYESLQNSLIKDSSIANQQILEINVEDPSLVYRCSKNSSINWTICTQSSQKSAAIKQLFPKNDSISVHTWNPLKEGDEKYPWGDRKFDKIIYHHMFGCEKDQAKVFFEKLRELLRVDGTIWIHEPLEIPYYTSLVQSDGLVLPNLITPESPGIFKFNSIWKSILQNAKVPFSNAFNSEDSKINLWEINPNQKEQQETIHYEEELYKEDESILLRTAYLVTEGVVDGLRIAKRISNLGIHKSVVWLPLESHGQQWPGNLDKNTDIILLYQLIDQKGSISTQNLENELIPEWFKIIEFFQSIVEDSIDSYPEVFMFTQGAIATPPISTKLNLRQAALPGMINCFQSEYSDLGLKWIDLDPDSPFKDNLVSLCSELKIRDDETEIAYRGKQRLGSRLKKGSLFFPDKLIERENRHINNEYYQLRIGQGNTIDSLAFAEFSEKKLEDHYIEVKVQAAALNFRDVLKVLSLYPADSDDYLKLGDECAGIINKVGAKVTNWKIGDKVIVIGNSCLASHVVAHEDLVFAIPAGFTFEEGASMPVVFMTAYYALNEVARLQPGESVLIHAAAGGVGLAAIQIAQEIGATIYATASSTKQPLLNALGIANIYNSRDLSFADEIRTDTQGRGVDVILNSLAGEAQEASLELLAPFGRFLEIGKRDIYENRQTGLYKFRENISFHAIDLSALMSKGSTLLKRFSENIFKRFNRQSGYYPIPLEIFTTSQIKQAFRKMSKGGHIGKLIISFKNTPDVIKPKHSLWKMPSADGTYIISGGTRGFGSEFAKFLISLGARNLILLSRSAPDSQNVVAVREKLKNLENINLIPLQVDVTNELAVKETIAEIKDAFPKIKGIIHTANVYKDQLLINIDRESFDAVYSAKVIGAWNLHQASLDLDLDFFVMTSSIASLLGNAGQISYASANSFLDNLAYHRKNLGLPATVINFGPLKDTGFIARNQIIGQRLETIGVDLLPHLQALQLTEFAKNNNITRVGAFRVNFFQYWKASGFGKPTPKIKELYEMYAQFANQTQAKGKIRSAILGAPDDQAVEMIVNYVKETVGKILGIDSKDILDLDGFNEIGLDSLMALEMQGKLERTFKIAISPVELSKEPTVLGLAKLIHRQVKSGGE